MIKQVIKEIGIAVMLLIAIALILSIIFYQYMPNNKTVPIAVKAYTFPEDIQEELKETINQKQENIIKTLYINDEDLDKYESKNYDKGKSNPFADYSSDKENNEQGNNNANVKPNGNTATSNNTQKENNTRNEVYVSTPGKN